MDTTTSTTRYQAGWSMAQRHYRGELSTSGWGGAGRIRAELDVIKRWEISDPDYVAGYRASASGLLAPKCTICNCPPSRPYRDGDTGCVARCHDSFISAEELESIKRRFSDRPGGLPCLETGYPRKCDARHRQIGARNPH